MEQLSLVPSCDKHGCLKAWIKNRCRKAGGQWTCKQCLRDRGRASYSRNKEKVNARSAAYAQANRELTNQAARKWREANPEKQRQAQLNWYHSNRDRASEAHKCWRESNRPLARERVRRYSARKAGCCVELDAIDLAITRAIYGKANRKGVTVDHIQPIRMQGEHAPWNLQLLAASENSSKGSGRPALKDVLKGERRYRLLRRIFENAMGAAAA